jgi:hypothetical protein
MPEYTFFNTETEEYRDVFFKMNDKKIYSGEDGSEVGKWRRVFHAPNASVDSVSNINPFDIKGAVEKTRNKKGSVGEMWDASREMSERRQDKIGGEDPIKRKFFDSYEKSQGVKHFHDKPDKIETKHATIDFKAKGPEFKEK